MIEPTVGRVVWFTPSVHRAPENFAYHGPQPCAAMVTYVHGPRSVNLVVFDHDGAAYGETRVALIQDDDARFTAGRYCEWMPYQIGQAAKSAPQPPPAPANWTPPEVQADPTKG